LKKGYKILPCPYCGVRQKVEKPIEGVFPVQQCFANYRGCYRGFYVNDDLTIRKLTEQESKMLKEAWIHFAKNTPILIHNVEKKQG